MELWRSLLQIDKVSLLEAFSSLKIRNFGYTPSVSKKTLILSTETSEISTFLDIDFLNNCKQLGVYPKFLIFKLPNVFNKDPLSIHKRLLSSAINKHNKELQHLSKELSLSEKILSTQLSTIDFYILTKFPKGFNIFLILFLVVLCLVVAVQPLHGVNPN